jgi:hypothetical protein
MICVCRVVVVVSSMRGDKNISAVLRNSKASRRDIACDQSENPDKRDPGTVPDGVR